MYKNVIFDVDGTIINSFEDVTGCACYALKKLGYPRPSDEQLKKFIGPSIYETMTVTLGLPEREAQAVVDAYRIRYNESDHAGTYLYEGFPELFKRLKDAGVKLSVASTKPERFLRIIFQKFGIDKYFEIIAGAPENAKDSDKVPIIKNARLDESAVMVGDRRFDIIAANALGLDSIGVTYGFMEDGEFEKYRPTYIAHTADDIFNIVMSNG